MLTRISPCADNGSGLRVLVEVYQDGCWVPDWAESGRLSIEFVGPCREREDINEIIDVKDVGISPFVTLEPRCDA